MEKVKDYPEILDVIAKCSIDHIGVRVDSIEKYMFQKAILKELGTMIAETIIPMNNELGRPIAIFELSTSLKTAFGEIKYFELPAPRPGVEEVDKIDHIEMVLPEGIGLFEFCTKFGEIFIQTGLCAQSDLDNLRLDIVNNKINPDLTIAFDQYKIKFHEKDIGTVIREEQSSNTALEGLATSFKTMYPGIMDEQ